VTIKAHRTDERDTGKPRRAIDAGILRIKARVSRAGTHSNAGIRHGHLTAVRVESMVSSVRDVVIKTTKR